MVIFLVINVGLVVVGLVMDDVSGVLLAAYMPEAALAQHRLVLGT